MANRLPLVIGLNLCERLGVDPANAQVSLIGIFHALRFPSFPSPAQKFTVYAALYDGVGEGTMELVLRRLETEEDFRLYRRWFTFPGRGQVVNVEIIVPRCVFPAPGRYSLSLIFDNQNLTQRHLDVFREVQS